MFIVIHESWRGVGKKRRPWNWLLEHPFRTLSCLFSRCHGQGPIVCVQKWSSNIVNSINMANKAKRRRTRRRTRSRKASSFSEAGTCLVESSWLFGLSSMGEERASLFSPANNYDPPIPTSNHGGGKNNKRRWSSTLWSDIGTRNPRPLEIPYGLKTIRGGSRVAWFLWRR